MLSNVRDHYNREVAAAGDDKAILDALAVIFTGEIAWPQFDRWVASLSPAVRQHLRHRRLI